MKEVKDMVWISLSKNELIALIKKAISRKPRKKTIKKPLKQNADDLKLAEKRFKPFSKRGKQLRLKSKL